MKLLITGNLGYVGPHVIRCLRHRFPEAQLIGLDTAYFSHCLTNADVVPEYRLDQQHYCDVRHIPEALLEGVTGIVHLAAISNDPMGNLFEDQTIQVNGTASVKLCAAAKRAGVRNFVFASSCSMYGAAAEEERTESSPLQPLTAYARSKVLAEERLAELAGDGLVVTALRFATACGMSERLRLDLVLNDFVACAVAGGKITLLSDGSAWRPLINVQDMARALAWGLKRTPETGGEFLAVNAGSDEMNYRVRDMAEAVARVIPGVEVSINEGAEPDSRSYRVSFARLRELAPEAHPQVNLEQSIRGLEAGLRAQGFSDANFRQSSLIRLNVLKAQLARGALDRDLYWSMDTRDGE